MRHLCESFANSPCKTRLGLADFRMRSVEATTKYFGAVFVTLAYLHWRFHQSKDRSVKTLSDAIALHRQEQWQATLRDFGRRVLRTKAVEPVVEQFLMAA